MQSTLSSRRAGLLIGLATSALTTAAVFWGEGGSRLPGNTRLELLVCALAALIVAAAFTTGRWPGGFRGGAVLAGLAALVGLTGLSILWSLAPDQSWLETNRGVAYLAVLTAGMAALSLAPDRLPAVLHGLLAGLAIACGYALATKVFPGSLAEQDTFARLREPFGYWNAVGLSAALGVLLALWAGARREAHPALAVAAYPLLGLFGLALMLSLSRGSLVALAAGLLLWFVFVPLRLRSAAMLAVGAAVTAILVAWAFSEPGISDNEVTLAVRSDAGTQLGVYLALALALLAAAGHAIARRQRAGRLGPEPRRRLGRGLVGALGATAVVGLLALTVVKGGPEPLVSDTWHNLTSPDVGTPANTPNRLRAASSIRSRYWRDAVEIFGDHPLTGAGAGGFDLARFRYRRDLRVARHAHGFPLQTAADLGLLGLAISLALAAAFGIAAVRVLGAARAEAAPGEDWPPRATALWALAIFVAVFGVHSAIDWTWFVPGVAMPALFAAGWLAASAPSRGRQEAALPGGALHRALPAAAVVLLAILAAIAMVQPLRAHDRIQEGVELGVAGRFDAARESLREASEINPLTVEPFFNLAVVEFSAGRLREGAQALEAAVRLQPANPQTWIRLGQYQLAALGRPDLAVDTLAAALFLDPRSHALEQVYANARRAELAAAARERANRRR